MGQTYSTYMLERKEKARSKRKLIKRLDEAGEVIELLQERYERMKNEVSEVHLEISSTEMAEERKASDRKISYKEMVLDHNNQKCDELLNKNFCNFKNRRNEVQRQNLKEREKLAVLKWLKKRIEANQLSMFKKKHPLDTWTVRSLPNLHFAELPL